MGIIRIGRRGTSRRISEKEEDNWTGDAFKKISNKRKESAKDAFISIGRGTAKIKFGDLAETSGRPSGKGRYVSTGRGTGKRKIE